MQPDSEPSINVTLAQASDLDTIQSILNDVRAWLGAKGLSQWSEPFSDEWVIERIEKQQFYLVEHRGLAVALFRLLWSDPDFWGDTPDDASYLHTFAVRRGWAGHGIGKEILCWVEERSAREDKQYVRLDCSASNARMRRYYEEAGFTRIREKQMIGWTALLMEKRITQSGAEQTVLS